jgi:hypothetical protein
MEIFLITTITLIASIVGAVSGFGTSTIMIPVLLIFLPLPETLLFVGIIHAFNDIWKIILFKSGLNWRIILTFGVPGIIFSFIGASLILNIPPILLTRGIGVFLLVYAIFILVHPSFKIASNNSTAIIGGSLSGFFAGIFGTGGAIRSAFLSMFNLPKSVYIFTGGAIALIIDSTRIVTYLFGGIGITQFLLLGLILFVPVSFIGVKIGQQVVTNIPQKQFRTVIVFFLFLLSVKLILFP